MATGRAPGEPVAHPDPKWWMRGARAVLLLPTDLCEFCGHTRDLHTASGCRAASAAMVLRPHRCLCSNTVSGPRYRSANTQRPRPTSA
jgi:hypothetical protein